MALMAVTGAFSFSGRHIAARLLDAGHEVVNLTNHPDRADPFGGRTRVRPLTFDEDGLAADLAGVDTLFNTYWVRFARGTTDHRLAVDNSRVLLAAAARAGVRRIVHVSIANLEDRPSDPYYAGKGEVERALRAAGPSWAILRPAVLFGDEPILVNSIAWLLRHLPVFLIPGDGRYGIQPAHVEDLADLAVAAAAGTDNTVQDVAGPETFTFEELLRLIRHETGSRSLLLHAPSARRPAGGAIVVADPGRRADHAPGDGRPVGRRPGQPPAAARAAALQRVAARIGAVAGTALPVRGGAAFRHGCSPRLMRAAACVARGWGRVAPGSSLAQVMRGATDRTKERRSRMGSFAPYAASD